MFGAACPQCSLTQGVGPGMHWKGRGLRDRRFERVAEAVGGGCCRLQMPLSLAPGVRGTVAGHRLGAWRGWGGGGTPFQCIPGWGPHPRPHAPPGKTEAIHKSSVVQSCEHRMSRGRPVARLRCWRQATDQVRMSDAPRVSTGPPYTAPRLFGSTRCSIRSYRQASHTVRQHPPPPSRCDASFRPRPRDPCGLRTADTQLCTASAPAGPRHALALS